VKEFADFAPAMPGWQMCFTIFRKGRMSLEELVGHVDKSAVISIVVTIPGNPWYGGLLFN